MRPKTATAPLGAGRARRRARLRPATCHPRRAEPQRLLDRGVSTMSMSATTESTGPTRSATSLTRTVPPGTPVRRTLRAAGARSRSLLPVSRARSVPTTGLVNPNRARRLRGTTATSLRAPARTKVRIRAAEAVSERNDLQGMRGVEVRGTRCGANCSTMARPRARRRRRSRARV